MARIIPFYFIILFAACATNPEPVPSVPNYDYGELRKPPAFNQDQKQAPEPSAQPQTTDSCVDLCKTFNDLDEKCDLANDACEAKTNYLRSVNQADCTKIAAREAVDCKGVATCLDRVSAGEAQCKLAADADAWDNAKCKEALKICAQKTTAQNALGSCKC